MREVSVDRQRLADSHPLHHDETQAVHGAVALVGVPSEVRESRLLLLESGLVDARHLLAVENLARRNR
jgi:hypothetical protein